MKLEILCIHCTDTAEGREVTADELRQWHLGPKDLSNGKVKYMGKVYTTRSHLPNEFIGGKSIKTLKGNGWSKLGYTDMVHLDGSLENLTPYDQDDNVEAWELTYGAAGINAMTRHIVYVGGKSKNYKESKDTKTPEQKESLEIYAKFAILRHPCIKVGGHNQFTKKKACPSYNVPFWCNSICISEENIYQET